MNLWRMIRGMFSSKVPRDPAAQKVRAEAETKVSETYRLTSAVRQTYEQSAERRRLDNARRHYEDRLHGKATFGH